jgi:hypothetical protein
MSHASSLAGLKTRKSFHKEKEGNLGQNNYNRHGGEDGNLTR